MAKPGERFNQKKFVVRFAATEQINNQKSCAMKYTRWGIIGPGKIAHDFAKDLALLDGPQTITAVLGKQIEEAKSFAHSYSAPQVFTKLDEFIEKAGIDIAYIATPHTLHHKEALACLQHNIPVLCEKPMTINLDQCDELIAASREHHTFLMEGMWIRFLPGIKQSLAMVERGDIGRIISVKASMGFKAPKDPNSRLFNPDLGGGSLLDLGIYPVFLSVLLMGRPTAINATATLTKQGIDEHCSILFKYPNGQQAILESTLLSDKNVAAEITGDKGSIRILDPWFEKSEGLEIEINGKGKVIYPTRWQGHGLHFEATEALSCLRDNKIESDLLPHRFSRELIGIMDEIRQQIHVSYEMYE